MNRPALIRHLLIKDLRCQRGLLALVWLLALLMPLMARFMSPGSVSVNVLLIGPACLFALVSIVIILRVIQLDPPGRGIHFLSTRPIGRASLLVSKLLFACAFLLIPDWIATLGSMYAVGMHFTFLDAVLFLIEGTISAGALFAVVAAPAFLLPKLISAVMTIIGGAVLAVIAGDYYVGYLFFSEFLTNPPESYYQIEHCRWLMFQLGLAFTGLAGALFCYRKRPMSESFLVLVSGLFVSVMLALFWPINLSVIFSDRMPALAPALRDQIKFHMEAPPAHGTMIASNVKMSVRGGLSGLQLPYFYLQTGDNAVLTLRSGRKIALSYMDDDWSKELLLQDDQKANSLEAKLMGFALLPGEPQPWRDEVFQAIPSLDGRYPDGNLSGVSIKGIATFTIGRAFIAGTLPPHASRMAINLPRRRYRLQDVEASPDRITLHIVKEYMAVTLRGDLPDQEKWENLSWSVINRRKGEYLIVTGHGPDDGYLETLQVTRPDLAKGPIPPDWINDAEIVCVSSESCGRISFPYEIPSIDLIH